MLLTKKKNVEEKCSKPKNNQLGVCHVTKLCVPSTVKYVLLYPRNEEKRFSLFFLPR